jgi:quercetin dioxygenase-like cupin family protein
MKERVIASYRVNGRDVPDAKPNPKTATQKTGLLSAKIVFGTDTSLMIATRQRGYHSLPHVHDAEQLNYVLSGSIWFFIEEEGIEAVEGDFVRIPKGKVHWAWTKSGPCTLVEVHAPPLIGDAELREKAVGLLSADEDGLSIQGIENIFVDYPGIAEIEKRACGETE